MSGHEKLPESSSLGATRRYRLLAVGLYDIELAIADRLAEALRTAGWPRANRSLVIREALRRLNDDLLDKPAADVLDYFVDRQACCLRDRKTPVRK
jgi:hypothetical protein